MNGFGDREAGRSARNGCPLNVSDLLDSPVTETGFLHLFVWLHEKSRPDA